MIPQDPDLPAEISGQQSKVDEVVKRIKIFESENIHLLKQLSMSDRVLSTVWKGLFQTSEYGSHEFSLLIR